MSNFIYKIIVSISILLITTTQPIQAQAPEPIEPPKVLSVKETISYYASINEVSERELMLVAKCESSFNPKATGDGGRAKNIFQYHKPTFDSFSKLLGEELDYHSYNDQAKLTAYIWANYPKYKSHWTCAKIMGVI